jgi:hypothetical protein
MKINFLLVILVLIGTYFIPMFGIFMEDKWYQYLYILGSHTIGLLIFMKTYKKYLGV